MRAGSEGSRIDTAQGRLGRRRHLRSADGPGQGDALLSCRGRKADGCASRYIVTDDDRRFQSVARRLPEGVEPIRLYESYLTNFRFSNGPLTA
jgi:adenine-specific DNA-methyltransferase